MAWTEKLSVSDILHRTGVGFAAFGVALYGIDIDSLVLPELL